MSFDADGQTRSAPALFLKLRSKSEKPNSESKSFSDPGYYKRQSAIAAKMAIVIGAARLAIHAFAAVKA